jgi:Sel1 repeat
MKMYLAIIIACSSLLAQAQTPLHTQTKDRDYCAGDDPDTKSAYEMLQCARGNGNSGTPNYAAALKWYTLAADYGELFAQTWLGFIYQNESYARDYGIPPDLVQAYKWYDIAAATNEVCTDRLPLGANRENNHREMNYREEVAKQMKPEQIMAERNSSGRHSPRSQGANATSAQ